MVKIMCEGKAMREHGPTLCEGGREVFCYLASQPGKVSVIQLTQMSSLVGANVPQEFHIEYSRNLNFGPPDTELVADVYIGGVFDGPGWIAPDPLPRSRKVTGEIWGSRRGNKLHHYTFSKPDLIGSSWNVLEAASYS